MRTPLIAMIAALAFGSPLQAQSWSGSPAPVLRSAADPGARSAGARVARLARTAPWCRAQRANLYRFQRQARWDGRVAIDEMRVANALRADLASQCGMRTRWTLNRWR